MRIRTVKPDFFLDEELCSRPPLERLLFQSLWLQADRDGRLEDRPLKIKAQALPYDQCDVDGMLDSLQAGLFILRYEADGRKYIQIRTFKKNQRPNNKEAESEIPAPPGGDFYRRQACPPAQDPTRRGKVYFIQAGTSGPIKIGFSANPSARVRDLQAGSPIPYVLLGHIDGSVRDETVWHQRFAGIRIDREWFRADQELISAIASSTKSGPLDLLQGEREREREREQEGKGNGVTSRQEDGTPPPPPPNPLVDRPAMEKRFFALVREIAPRVDLDPTEVAKKATEWKGRSYIRPDTTMTDDRLAHSVASLERWARKLNGRAEPQLPAVRAGPSPKAQQRVDVIRAGVMGGLTDDERRELEQGVHGAERRLPGSRDDR